MAIDKAKHSHVIHPLPALFDSSSRILILGSFPSVKTREAAFFYGHRQNRFWPLLSALLEIDPPLSATEPKRAKDHLLARGVALWDSIQSCEIIGSSDSSIRGEKPNDFTSIFATAAIRHIFCNGSKAYENFVRYQKLPPAVGISRLPSTSPANASKSLADLIRDWSPILAYLL